MMTVLFGADAGCGCTTLAQSIAEGVAEINKEKKVLLLFLSGYPGTEYCQDEFTYCLDDLYIKINTGVLTGAEIDSTCVKKGNLYVLQGTKNLKMRKLYMPDEIIRFLKLAEKQFDEVIVDAGSSLDYGLSVGALLYGGRNILVVTQRKLALDRFLQKEEILSELEISFECMIINKFIGKSFLPSEKITSTLYQLKDFYVIDMSEYGLQAEKDNINVTELDKSLKKELNPLMNFIAGKNIKTKKKVIWGLFGRA